MRTTLLLTLTSTMLSWQIGCSANKNADPAAQDPSPHTTAMPTTNGVQTSAGATIKNLDSLISGLNLTAYHDAGFKGQNTTVAILDNGYWGLSNSLGTTLPPNLVIEQAASGSMAQTVHGTKLAEIVYALTTGHDLYDRNVIGPEIKLYVTSGAYLNFEKAVNDLIKFKAANPYRTVIALYAQIWQYGGNDNGVGYINTLVTKAAKAGIVWVNAVGNLGKTTYFDVAKRRADGYLTLPFEEKSIRFSVGDDSTQLTIALSWDDFASTYFNYATSIDLDLTLEDASGKVMAKGNMIQDGKNHGDTVGYSRFARELIMAKLDKGEYRLLVSTKDLTLPDNLTFTLSVDGPNVIMENSKGYQKVFMPADDPDALTVGAYDVDFCNAIFDATTKRFTKPDMWTASIVEYSDGSGVMGSSTSAAIAAAALAVKASSMEAILTKEEVTAALASGKISANRAELQALLGTHYKPDQGISYPAVLRLGTPTP